jgi:GH24 family phage-related lysozyme (muramidase)
MSPSDDAIKLCQYFEGCKLEAYLCSAGVWTIGWGSTGKDIRRGLVWSQAQCDARFVRDLNTFAVGVDNLLKGSVTSQKQFDALVSFAYNCGLGNLASSTLLKKHKAGDFAGAQAEFQRWNKGGGKELKGLTIRRKTEAKIYGGASDVAKLAQEIARGMG